MAQVAVLDDNLQNAKESLNQFLNLEENLYGFRSEISPFYPGTIYDGGELGYSLAVAMGAVLDNEDLTAVVILGDGECETGCISAAWKSIKCLGKKRGHLLPIINLNEYRMGGRSLLSMMDADCHPKRPPVPYYPASVSHIIRPAINHYSTVLLT